MRRYEIKALTLYLRSVFTCPLRAKTVLTIFRDYSVALRAQDSIWYIIYKIEL